ncbi:hypothetical protein AB0F92_39720 [Kitasatospora aureofaciens]|uniref:hypothetical protein n=1 Tax=Kitasatospora aureofaciens TaxID=1894 RepID=UPI0033F6FE96
MRSIDASQGPQPGKHNWFRGATLRTYEAQALGALEELRGHIDVAPAYEVWTQALEARWDGTDVWFHGDLAKGNRPLARPTGRTVTFLMPGELASTSKVTRGCTARNGSAPVTGIMALCETISTP